MATRILESPFGKGRSTNRLPLNLIVNKKGDVLNRRLQCIRSHLSVAKMCRGSACVGHQSIQYSTTKSKTDNSAGKENNTTVKDSEVIWLFPAGSTIERFDAASARNALGFSVTLTINSSTFLTDFHFERALTLLLRKVQILRICLRRHENKLWICENTNAKLDFEVLSEENVMAAAQKLACVPFNSEVGPLWRARFQPSLDDAERPVPGLKSVFPHQYKVVLSFHHGANDGTSVMIIIRYFLKILEDVALGIAVNLEQLGNLISNEYIENMEREIQLQLEKDPQALEKQTKEVLNAGFKPLLTEAFGNPDVSEPSSAGIYSFIDKFAMQTFSDKCKTAGITINTGLTSVINTALVELAKEAGLKKDSYNITTRMAVDMRRYREEDSQTILGCHMQPFSHTTCTPHYIKHIFWEYAKKLDTEIRWKLKNNYGVKEKVIRDMNRPKNFSYDQFYSSPPPITYDYFMSNEYSPKFSDFGIGRHIQLVDMKVFQVMQNLEYDNFQGIHGMRDQVVHVFLYNTANVSEETAKKISKKFPEILRELTQM